MAELIDFNKLIKFAQSLCEKGDYADAIKLYLFMSDGDPSLDAGYFGTKLGEAYEALGDLHAAKYWHGRAVEENPEGRLSSVDALERLSYVSVDHIIEWRKVT